MMPLLTGRKLLPSLILYSKPYTKIPIRRDSNHDERSKRYVASDKEHIYLAWHIIL
jgi:hypothetical protein